MDPGTERRGSSPVVLFDLFNTLIPGGTRAHRDAVSQQMGEDLGVEPEACMALMVETYDARSRGALGGLPETFATVAHRLGAAPPEQAITRAVERRCALTLGLHHETWARPALDALRARGARLGLVSDCSAETPAVWPDSPLAGYFDAVSFSSETGVRKPGAEAYLVAVRALGAEPAECLFVGDGGSHELTGAAALGMRAVRFIPPAEHAGPAIDPDGTFDGPAIGDLSQVLELL